MTDSPLLAPGAMLSKGISHYARHGQPIGSIVIKPNGSFVKNDISGETIPISKADESALSDFVQRYLLAPAEKHIGLGRA